jgi:hypothetical protein
MFLHHTDSFYIAYLNTNVRFNGSNGTAYTRPSMVRKSHDLPLYWTAASCSKIVNISTNLKQNSKHFKWFIRALGGIVLWKKRRKKILWHCSFKSQHFLLVFTQHAVENCRFIPHQHICSSLIRLWITVCQSKCTPKLITHTMNRAVH